MSSPEDAVWIQSNLDFVTTWSDRYALRISVDKCKVLTFTRRDACVAFSYSLHNEAIKRVTKISDLGVTFSSTLSFEDQID